ncbi:MAG TPA: ABC transporter permease [Vicinamibacterales bacterium]|nr:ABC transporter permease [Vicinamibacterales bacterium]
MTLKHAIRRLIAAPGFSLLAVLTLAIGIGANAAIFSVVDGILLKALPYPRADELVAVDHRAPGVKLESAGSAPFLYFTYRDQMKTVQDVGLWRPDTASITGEGEPEEIPTIAVTDGVLPMLDVQPIVGRLFTRTDDSPESPATMILAYGYWKTRFGGDASIVGRRVLADGQPRDVIGVMPQSFRFLDRDASAFLPLRLDRNHTFLGNFSYRSIARLRPGATPEAAEADAARLVPAAIHAFPSFPGFSTKLFEDVHLTPVVRPLKQDIVGDIGRVLWVLMGTIALVLLIACANVANLLLVRTDGRQQELAIRAALGAGRGRIAKELIVESIVLGLAGGLVGLGLAFAGVRLLVAIAPTNLPRLHQIAIDLPVVLFTFGVSIAAGALFGAIPVLKYAGPRINTALRAGGRTISDSRERHRARNTLVIAQVALALVLLVGSGLMIRTFLALRHVDPGFTRPEDLLTFRISIPSAAVKDPLDVVRAQQAIAEKIATVPGVASVGITTTIPMDGQGRTDAIFAEDRPLAEGQLPPLRRFLFIAPGVLQTMGNRLVAGRDFAWEDLYDERHVALVSENLARELWKDPQAAVGKRIRDSSKSPWREIVGVVGDERLDGVDHKAPPFVCWPLLMDDFSGDKPSVTRTVAFVVRSPRAASSGLLADVGRAVWSVNPNLPLARVRTMQEVYDKSLARTSFTLVMLSIAGAMALLLGVAGLYGVISYAVSQRTREIGIRMALGARAGEVTRMFVDQGLRLAGVGILVGLAAAAALTRLMASLLFDVAAVDPLTYAGVAAGLAAAAVLASYVPALRAATIDPADALRAE